MKIHSSKPRPRISGKRSARIAVTLVAAGTLLLLAACSPTSTGAPNPDDGEITIACLVKDTSAAIWKAAFAGCQEAGDELGAKIIQGGGTSDADLQGQLSAFKNAITKGADGIAFAAVDGAGMLSAVEDATKSGVLVSTFDSTVDGGDLVTNAISNDVQGAYLGGKFLAEQIGGAGEVAITTCSQSITTCRNVVEGFDQAMAEYPDITVVGRPDATPDRNKAFQAITNVLGGSPNLAGVYSTYDLDGLGALEAGNAKGIKLVVVSRGCSMEGLQSVADGGLTGCNALFIKREAYAATKALIDSLNGETVEKEIQIDSEVVSKENVDAWLAIPEFTGPPSK